MIDVDRDALARTLEDLDNDETAPEDAAAGLRRALEAAAGLIPDVGVGLILLDPDDASLRYVAATDAVARKLERAHLATGEGPSIDAFAYGEPRWSSDLLEDERWPRLAEALRADPVRAVAALPMRVGGQAVGSLDAYAVAARPWLEGERDALAAFNHVIEARMAAVISGRQSERNAALADQLQRALDRRVQIERAVGFLMGTRGISGVEAFHLLRRAARPERRGVADVALDVLAGRFDERGLPPMDDGAEPA